MRQRSHAKSIGVLLLTGFASVGCAKSPVHHETEAWNFVVSGDSRNCGDVVMPAIAKGAQHDHAQFYWHLGDLRAIYKVDEDFAAEQRFRRFLPPPNITDYVESAWPDFLQHQVAPFGPMPFFLGIGNHETIPPKTIAQFRIEFQPLLDRPELRAQRLRDSQATSKIPSTAADQTYFHWTQRGVDFINLDNASGDAFNDVQLAWFDAVIAADLADASVHSIVVGMHEALPYSKSESHSMCANPTSMQGGMHVYSRLAQAQQDKPVYVLASHSHYYLADVYNTPHWREAATTRSVLPGWIVGTAGAERYALPSGIPSGQDARERTYGYLLGTVAPNGQVTFEFRALVEDDLQRSRDEDFPAELVTYCASKNFKAVEPHIATLFDDQCSSNGP